MLIAIEGVDGSGKETQSKLLYKHLADSGKNPLMISFPAYDSASSALVKMYLAGEFGNNANDVPAKVASCFFAMDRYASYQTGWKTDYQSGRTIIADRYTTSNMVHQASKIEDITQKDEFLAWLFDFEYNILGLPKPDIVIFLDMPPEFAAKITADRLNKADGTDKKDIHEQDAAYIMKSYNNAKYIAGKYGWVTVECVKDGRIRSIEDIAAEVQSAVCKAQRDLAL